MKRLQFIALIVALALAAIVVAAAQPASSTFPTASCGQIVLHARSGTDGGFRVLLGKVSIPDERHTSRAALRRPERPWPYFRRVDLVVRGDASHVRITVPEGWRHRAAVSWGNTPAVSSLQIPSCGTSASTWSTYSGGFYLRSRADCVPLDVQVGGRSTSVRLGIGRACGNQ